MTTETQSLSKSKSAPPQVSSTTNGHDSDSSASPIESVKHLAKDVGEKVTETYSNAEKYLRETSSIEFARDIKGVVVKNPMAAAGVGIGLGFLLGRMFSRR